ncbi:MAG: FkbM family methyltransferase [Hydrogenobaculum sp.]|nr:MAG: FkbM family methyltransferase [Hydrogenobaculum sp.]
MYNIIDIGCRWGFADRFIKNIDKLNIFGFDPDEEECKTLQAKYNHPHIRLVPFALSDDLREYKLHITENPGCSSIYKPDDFVLNTFLWCGGQKPKSEAYIKTITLDLWAKENNISSADYIKIDVQGAELDVLRGAKDILKTTSFIEIEVEFNPLYEGIPLFSHIDLFLRDQGFVLYRFLDLNHYGVFGEKEAILKDFELNFDAIVVKAPMRGGQLYWGDALYVKENIAKGKLSSEELEKTIELANILGYFDIARRLEVFRAFKNETYVDFLHFQGMLSEHSNIERLKEIEYLKHQLEIYKSKAQRSQELEDELNQTKEQLNSVLNSRSWRITKPIREFKKFLKSLLS